MILDIFLPYCFALMDCKKYKILYSSMPWHLEQFFLAEAVFWDP